MASTHGHLYVAYVNASLLEAVVSGSSGCPLHNLPAISSL